MIKTAAAVTKLSKDDPPAVVIVTGAEEFLRAEVRAAFVKSLGDELDLVDLPWGDGDGRTTDAVQVFDELRAASLFSSRRLIAVANADAFVSENGAALAVVFGEMAEGTHLFLEGEALVKKRGKTVDLSKAMQKLVDAGAMLVDAAPLYDTPFDSSRSPFDTELVSWIVQRARSIGKVMDAEAAYMLHMATGSGLRGLSAQLEKLALHVDKRDVISADDVAELVGQSREGNLFDLIDSVASRDLERSIHQAERIFKQGTQDGDRRIMDANDVFSRFTALMGLRWHEIGRVVEAQRAGEDFDTAATSVFGAHRKWLFKKLRGQIQARSPRELGDAICDLADMDRDFKSSSGDARELLSRYLVVHCQPADVKGARR